MLEAQGIGGSRNGLLELGLEVGNGGRRSFLVFGAIERGRERKNEPAVLK